MVGKRLRILRRNANLTMKELGKKIGVAESTISNYENGHREPDFETLDKFANLFGVSIDYLLGRDEISTLNYPRYIRDSDLAYHGKEPLKRPEKKHHFLDISTVVSVPILGSVRAGEPIEMILDMNPECELVNKNLIGNNAALILEVKGDSMSGDFIFNGDRVVVIYTPDFSPSDICVVSIDNENATLKRVKCQGEMCMLIPSNPKMEPMLYPSKDVHVIGVVVEVRRRIKR